MNDQLCMTRDALALMGEEVRIHEVWTEGFLLVTPDRRFVVGDVPSLDLLSLAIQWRAFPIVTSVPEQFDQLFAHIMPSEPAEG